LLSDDSIVALSSGTSVLSKIAAGVLDGC